MANHCFCAFILMLGCFTLSAAQHWDNRGQNNAGSKLSGKSYVYGTNMALNNAQTATVKPQTVTRAAASSGGVGAWGYMAIILSIVLSGLAAYYFVILYPVVCKKERMYDVMEMTAV